VDSTTEPNPQSAYVFGYGSLVAMRESLQTAGDLLAPVPGRLHGFRRLWGVAMDNWEAAPMQKHFVDPATRQPPRIRVAFLDVEEGPEGVVNGLAVPVDAARLGAMDEREVNYSRVDVSSSFEPRLPYRVYTYRGSEEARARCRVRDVDASVYVSRDYLVGVRRAFASLGPGSLAEFERTTAPLSFPLRSLELVQPGSSAVDASGA
jgi:cation transport regulator ChaC